MRIGDELVNRRDVLASMVALAVLPASAKAVTGAARAKACTTIRAGTVTTLRHHTAYIESGPTTGPLMIFLHGFPELGLVWKAQMAFFGARGWRCIAPDMRGYGGSSAPTDVAAYAVPEIVADMVELHDALGASPAVWVGHDWGAPIAWAMASHHAERCRAIVALSVPYHPLGHALPNLVPLIDRRMYPADRFPVGQWDYWLYYRENLSLIRRDFERDVAATITALYQTGKADDASKPSPTASLRRDGGWFGPRHNPPSLPRDDRLLPKADHDVMVTTFRRTGFTPAVAWYLNDAANLQHAAAAPRFGRVDVPALFLHGDHDPVDETNRSDLAVPMRLNCSRLSEVHVASGHFIMLERKAEVCETMERWLRSSLPPLVQHREFRVDRQRVSSGQ